MKTSDLISAEFLFQKIKKFMKKNPLILAIDTSCDDTSASVVRGTTILSNIIASQTQLHKQYGGVFPTVAKQAHLENIAPVVNKALKKAGVTTDLVDAIAVTAGPGLAPALEVGLEFAKNLAIKSCKPLIPVNHIEGHLLSVLARPNSKKTVTPAEKINYPVLSLIVSGGHTQFAYFEKIGEYEILGQTLDDAAGECLDKIGRMLNLGYPAGPVIEEFAKLGDKNAYKFPLPLTQTKDFNLSFSGLKTFARNLIADLDNNRALSKQQVYDLSAGAQYGVFRHINYKLEKILKKYPVGEVWLGGGVAANINLRKEIRKTISNSRSSSKTIFRTPYSKKLCMDNAAMIGIAGSYLITNHFSAIEVANVDRLPRWPLEIAYELRLTQSKLDSRQ